MEKKTPTTTYSSRRRIDGVTPKEIHERVLLGLKSMGSSGRKMCEDLNYSSSVLWNMSNYYPSIQVVIDIANYLGCTINWLLTGENTDKHNEDDLYLMVTPEEKEVVSHYMELEEEDRNAVAAVINAIYSKKSTVAN